jgi:hypothetical protein
MALLCVPNLSCSVQMTKPLDPLSLAGQLLHTIRPSAIELARERERERERLRKLSPDYKEKTKLRMRKRRGNK